MHPFPGNPAPLHSPPVGAPRSKTAAEPGSPPAAALLVGTLWDTAPPSRPASPCDLPVYRLPLFLPSRSSGPHLSLTCPPTLPLAPLPMHQMGFPIMIKATAGGGGRGMRLANHMDEFVPLLKQAQQARRGGGGRCPGRGRRCWARMGGAGPWRVPH